MKHLLDEYKTIKNQKQYLKIIFANIINRFGDSIDAIAFTWLVYELTGSPAWSTIIFGANMVPTILIQPFAGALVEKLQKRNIMVLCDIARGVMVSIIAFCYLTGILQAWMLLVITVLNSTVEAFRVPAGSAIVPHLLEREYFETGIALNSSMSRAMELIGTGCAGVIIGLFGISSAIFIDAITFFASALIIAMIRYNEQIVQVKISLSSYMQSLKEGLQYIRAQEIVIILCIIACFLNMMLVPINSFLPAYVDQVLKGGSEILSLLTIGITIGSILGSFFYPILIRYFTKRQLLLVTTLYTGLFCIGMIVIPAYIDLPIYLIDGIIFILFLLIGILSSAASTFTAVLMTSIVDTDSLARASSVFGAFATLMIPVGSLLTTFLLQFFDFIAITVMFGIASILLFFIYAAQKKFYLLDSKES